MPPDRSQAAPPEDEAGPRASERPWPDHVALKECPHCGAEIGEGHYVCWNCSNDVRAPPESEMYAELETMLARRELDLKERDRRFWGWIFVGLVIAGVGSLVVWTRWWGMAVLFFLAALFVGRAWYRSHKSARRIRSAHDV